MPRTKQALKRRSKPHQKTVLRLRKRKNKLRAARRSARSRPHRAATGKKKAA